MTGGEEKIKRFVSDDLDTGNRIDWTIGEAYFLGHVIKGATGAVLLTQSAKLADMSLKYLYDSDDFDIKVNPRCDQLANLIRKVKDELKEKVALIGVREGSFLYSMVLEKGKYRIDFESDIRGYEPKADQLRYDARAMLMAEFGISEETCTVKRVDEVTSVKQIYQAEFYNSKVDQSLRYSNFYFRHEDLQDEWTGDSFYCTDYAQAKTNYDVLAAFLEKSKR